MPIASISSRASVFTIRAADASHYRMYCELFGSWRAHGGLTAGEQGFRKNSITHTEYKCAAIIAGSHWSFLELDSVADHCDSPPVGFQSWIYMEHNRPCLAAHDPPCETKLSGVNYVLS